MAAKVNNNPLTNDTAVGRGVRTAIQAVAGFLIGLVTTIWAVPGVPEAVTNYLSDNVLQLALVIGVPAGLVAFVWNLFRKNVRTV